MTTHQNLWLIDSINMEHPTTQQKISTLLTKLFRKTTTVKSYSEIIKIIPIITGGKTLDNQLLEHTNLERSKDFLKLVSYTEIFPQKRLI